MKIEKTNSGKYRVRTQVDGKRYCFTFDHKPKESEVAVLLADAMKQTEKLRDTFKACAESYMDSKSNVLSPATIKGYDSLLRASIPDVFKNKKISDITQVDIQLVINAYAVNHAPKTVHNLHGFISAVLNQFRPNMIINTTLPQKVRYEPTLPSQEDVNKMLEMSAGTMFHIPIQLGMLGMRRSEVCAATIDDLEGNILHINKAVVLDKNNKWITKITKTTEGKRDIYLPDELVKEIQETGYIYKGWPNSIYDALQNYQTKLNMPHFRLHDLRHFYASYAHEKGMSDADIMASGGWKSDYTMKNVYRHAMKKEKEEKQKEIANLLFN